MSDNIETQLKLMMLQLQRSALIDTQTLFQLMIDKGICSIDDILATKDNIECNNSDVHRLDQEIANLKGEELTVPTHNNATLLSQLQKLLKELPVANSTSISTLYSDNKGGGEVDG